MKTLSILIPVYNEMAYVEKCLENVISAELPTHRKEIIIVNDGSTDTTADTLAAAQKKHPEVRVISKETNAGKGAAIRTALAQSTGEFIIIQDADLEYDPTDYTAILEAYDNIENASAVYGSRILGKRLYHNYDSNYFFYLGGRSITWLTNLVCKTTLTDQPTCYKSWQSKHSAGILKHCTSPGFEFEIELTAYLAKQTVIPEVPIHYYPRAKHHGKKITLSDFFTSVFRLLQIKFFGI